MKPEGTERHEVETHHAFRGIEFPEAAKPGCLSATTPCCLRSGPGTLDRRPLTTTPEHTTYFLAALHSRIFTTTFSWIAASRVHTALSPWFFNPLLRTCQRHGCSSCPRVCVFFPPVYVSPTIGMRSRPPRSWMMADTCFSLGFTRRMMSMLPSMRAQRLCRTYGS